MSEPSSAQPQSFSTYKPPPPEPLLPPLPLSSEGATTPTLKASVLVPVPSPLQSVAPEATPFGASSVAAPIVHFDPNATGSDDEEEEDRPKKKWKAGAGPKASGSNATGTEGEEDPDKGRRKIDIAYIQKKEKRHITFSKRKAGIMKKAYELATLTGTQVLLLVVSETGIVYTFTTAKFQPLVGAGPGGNPSDGQRLIQACLAVDPSEGSDYISPPPDGPLLPLPPSAINRPFEANSSIHGGQIALRTRTHRPGASHRAKPRPTAIRTQSGSSVAASLPTPVDHQMLMSPSSRMPQGDYSPLPSVLQGSVGPRGEPIQSAQEYDRMVAESQQRQQQRSPMPMYSGMPMHSPSGRIDDGYQGQPGMDYTLPSRMEHNSPQRGSPHPLIHQNSPHHSPSHHLHSSPLQQQQHQHLQQQRLAEQQMAIDGSPNQRRGYSEEGRQHSRMYSDEPQDRGMYQNPPMSAGAVYQQQMTQDEYMSMQSRRQ